MSTSPIVLVTGADGLIGRHIVQTLTRQKIGRVVSVSRGSSSQRSPDELRVYANLLDVKQTETLAEINPDIIVHAAAVLPVGLGDEGAAEKNKVIDRNVFQLVDSTKARLIYFSSISIYENNKHPWVESQCSRATSIYAVEKYRSEMRVNELCHPSVILRISSPYSAVSYERPGVLFHFVRQAVAGGLLTVSGNGHRTQDFIHGSDISSAVAAVINNWTSGEVLLAKETFNVASGKPFSMIDLAELIVRIAADGRVSLVRGVDEHYRADVEISYIRDTLGWTPEVSLEDGLTQLIRRARGADEDWFIV